MPRLTLFACALLAAGLSVQAREIRKIEPVVVDPDATGYGTFQSNNQKVLENENGIFMTHIRSRNEPYNAQCWRLLRSRDGGRTFSIVYEATHATNAPVIETDLENNVYLMRPDWSGPARTYLYRFLAARDYSDPIVTTYDRGVHGKFCMEIDLPRRRLYYFSADNSFHTLTFEGERESMVELTRPGPNAANQYPQLHLDSSGVLYAAWTTQQHGVYMYWDIHAMKSLDGGKTWTRLDGADLDLPVTVDSATGAEKISLESENEIHTWLSNFVPKQGKLHFFYMAQAGPSGMRYVRRDIETGDRDVDLREKFRGGELVPLSLDGFFATVPDKPGATLYCVTGSHGRIVCLASDDDGESWYDYAASGPVGNPYAIGGNKVITQDGRILGIFTDQGVGEGSSPSVQFFSIQTGND